MRAVVECLWRAWKSGAGTLTESYICNEADCQRLDQLFLGHPAWGRLIVRRKEAKGLLALAEPPCA